MVKNYPKNSSASDKEWFDLILKFSKPMSRLRLSNEDEETIRKIANKI
jgi:hypothetical protein